VPVGVDPGRDEGVDIDYPAVLADLDRERVDPDKRVRPSIQWPLAKRTDLAIEVAGHLADLRARQAFNPELLGEAFHPPSRDTQQVRGGDHRDQRLLGAPAMGQQPVRENEPSRNFGTASSTVPARVSHSRVR
jgi:hypothetical protein